ncbi:uncharacterized protein LOC143026502 isoform X2 [Oratosquilla oratoria]|uniref:uncharacterized protein LOC143026502 isoform X2 n=1 Tax=Oratosquilla oratoria TaxID=337810 RepID=UPI003F76BB7C
MKDFLVSYNTAWVKSNAARHRSPDSWSWSNPTTLLYGERKKLKRKVMKIPKDLSSLQGPRLWTLQFSNLVVSKVDNTQGTDAKLNSCIMEQTSKKDGATTGQGKRLVSQSRVIIRNVWEYFRAQDEITSEVDVNIKTATATGTSLRTVYKIKKQAKEGKIESPPPKKRHSRVMQNVSSFDEEYIRREILSFYGRGEIPTLDLLLAKVKLPPINFSSGRTSLYKLIRKIGFRYHRVENGRRILIEQQDLVSWRCRYLREKFKNHTSDNPRPEIYLDETWIAQNECVKSQNVGDREVEPPLKSGKGDQFIILHAGGENGFVPGGLLMCGSTEHHDSMNSESFHAWFEEQLLPNIQENSIIIMDSASYHNKYINKAPKRSSTKYEILHWLNENSIPHDPTHTRSELLTLINTNRHRQEYEIDKIASSCGHKVLRLPPYHCHLNPMQVIWDAVKNEIKEKYITQNSSQGIEEIAKFVLENITPAYWKKCIEDTRAIENEYRNRELALDQLFENFTITLEESDSDEDINF